MNDQEPADLHHVPSHYRAEPYRALPSSPDAEKTVISSFFLNPDFTGGLCEEKGLTHSQFHIPSHATIFGTIMTEWQDRRPFDLITITNLLRNRRQLDQCGGAAYITELSFFTATAYNSLRHIEEIQTKHTLRAIIKIGSEYSERARNEQDQAPRLLDEMEGEVMSIASHRIELSEAEPIKDTVMEAIHGIEKMYESKGEIGGVATGFHQFDKMTDGLQKTDMIVIAARPSMGKTALMMNIAEHMALDCKLAVAVFSLEMSKQQLMQRLLLSRARVNKMMLKEGVTSDRDFPAITNAAKETANSKLIINDKSGITIGYLRTALRRMMRKQPLSCAFIDYIQLLNGSKQYKGDNRQAEVAEVSKGVKELAKELGIPIVVLAQLTRAVDARGGTSKGRPKLSDLRESGSIEQDADIVALLTREEYYADNDEERKEAEGKATLIIAKQRNGPTGDVPLTFLKEFARFDNRAHEIEEYQEPNLPKNRQPVRWT